MSAFLENTVLFGVHGIFGRWLGVEENRGASKSWGAYGKSCMQHGMSGFVSSTVMLAIFFVNSLLCFNLIQAGTECHSNSASGIYDLTLNTFGTLP